jgi:hypothetical protein
MRFLLAGLTALICVLVARFAAFAPRKRGAPRAWRWRPIAVACVAGLLLASSVVIDPSIAAVALPAAVILGVACALIAGISAGHDFLYLLSNVVPIRMSSTYGYVAEGPEHDRLPMIAHDRWWQWRLHVFAHRSERVAFPIEART